MNSEGSKLLRTVGLLAVGVLAIFLVWLLRDPTPWLMVRERFEPLPVAPSGNTELRAGAAETKKALERGAAFLLSQQVEGRWREHPGITALCLRALLAAPLGFSLESQPALKQAADWLLSLQGADGSFAIAFSAGSSMRNYTTALSVLALDLIPASPYREAVAKAQQYLIKAQLDEGEGYQSAESNFGGLGYGSGGGADLSNLQLALEALRESGLDPKHEFFKKAQVFVERAQDGESNTASWAHGSGGFVYSPEKAQQSGNAEPYGAMTFAGLKSLIFTGAAPDDARVREALKWVERHYAVDQHPGRGEESLYFYYATMAKALSAAGVEELPAGTGTRSWAGDLARALIARQQPDGGWRNREQKYMEGLPELASAYAMMALSLAYHHLPAAEAPDARAPAADAPATGAAPAPLLSGNSVRPESP